MKLARSRGRQALLGAVLVHPLLFLLAFASGTIAGASKFTVFHPTAPPTEYGLQGGLNALGYVVVAYFWSFGIVPLIVSGAGAVLAIGAVHFFRPGWQRSYGAVGLLLSIIFCLAMMCFPLWLRLTPYPGQLFLTSLGGVMGLLGLLLSAVGIAKRSRPVEGSLGIFVFLFACVMMYQVIQTIQFLHEPIPSPPSGLYHER